jgi:hypothetical protein
MHDACPETWEWRSHARGGGLGVCDPLATTQHVKTTQSLLSPNSSILPPSLPPLSLSLSLFPSLPPSLPLSFPLSLSLPPSLCACVWCGVVFVCLQGLWLALTWEHGYRTACTEPGCPTSMRPFSRRSHGHLGSVPLLQDAHCSLGAYWTELHAHETRFGYGCGLTLDVHIASPQTFTTTKSPPGTSCNRYSTLVGGIRLRRPARLEIR